MKDGENKNDSKWRWAEKKITEIKRLCRRQIAGAQDRHHCSLSLWFTCTLSHPRSPAPRLTENSPWLSSIARPLPFTSELGHDWMMHSSTALQVEDNSSTAVHPKTQTKPNRFHLFSRPIFKKRSVVDSSSSHSCRRVPHRAVSCQLNNLGTFINRHLTHVVKETGSKTKQER